MRYMSKEDSPALEKTKMDNGSVRTTAREPHIADPCLRVETMSDFSSIAGPWSELLDRSNSDMVCLRPEWISSWWKAFGKDKEAFLLTVWENKRLVAIAPLSLSKISIWGFPIRRLQFMANGHSPRADIVADPTLIRPALRAIFEYLLTHSDLWDFMELRRIPTETGTLTALEEILQDLPFTYSARPSLRSPYISIETDWNSYFSSKSSKFRKVMRNKLNRVKRLGDSELEQLQDRRSVNAAMQTIFDLSRKSWKGSQESGIGNTVASREFYQALADNMGPRGWLRVWILRAAAKPIAFEWHLVYRNKAYALSSDFDESYRDYNPGSVLERLIIEEYFRVRVDEYDMCGADYPYKLKWTSTVKEHMDVNVYHPRWISEISSLWRESILPRLRSSRSLRVLKSRWHTS